MAGVPVHLGSPHDSSRPRLPHRATCPPLMLGSPGHVVGFKESLQKSTALVRGKSEDARWALTEMSLTCPSKSSSALPCLSPQAGGYKVMAMQGSAWLARGSGAPKDKARCPVRSRRTASSNRRTFWEHWYLSLEKLFMPSRAELLKPF